MKRLVIFLLVSIFLCSMVACAEADEPATKATPVSIKVIEEPLEAPVSIRGSLVPTNTVVEDKTADLKKKSYEALQGLTECDFYNLDGAFDLVEFSSAVGCSCSLSYDLTEIVVHPLHYNSEEDFRIAISFDSYKKMVNGDTIYVGRDGDEWLKTYSHRSATDCFVPLAVNDYMLNIGLDELDNIWRQLRLLTAPADKADEINAEIDAELESYLGINNAI